MKKVLFLTMMCLLGLFAVKAQESSATGTKSVVFAKGVSLNSGWYDVNKLSNGGTDINMCWAASSANIIQWWQDRYVAAGNTLPSGAVTGPGTKAYNGKKYNLAIMELYSDLWDNSKGGQVSHGVTWYFEGRNIMKEAQTGSHAQPLSGNNGGYYSNVWNQILPDIYHEYNYVVIPGTLEYNDLISGEFNNYSIWGYGSGLSGNASLKKFSDLVVEFIDRGVTSLTVALSANLSSIHHATTLWGYEIDNATGIITKVWLTDSDDIHQSGESGNPTEQKLREYTVSYNEGTGTIKFSGAPYGACYAVSLFPVSGYKMDEEIEGPNEGGGDIEEPEQPEDDENIEEPNKEPETISIGSGEGSINYAPTYVYNKYAMTQQIFTAEEMQNKSGKITSVTFQCVGTRSADRTFKVYMVNTNKTSFNGSTDWVAITESDLVYEGAVSFVGGSATTITFTTPFTYKKGQNVVLCVNDVTAMDQTKVTSFASETKSENRLLYVSNYYDIYDATNMSSEGTLKNVTNQVQFTIVGNGNVVEPEEPGVEPEEPGDGDGDENEDPEIPVEPEEPGVEPEEPGDGDGDENEDPEIPVEPEEPGVEPEEPGDGDGDENEDPEIPVEPEEPGVEPEEPGDAVSELSSSFRLYPNPVNDVLFIETEVEIEEVVIYDVYGRIQNLRTSESQNLRISVDVANLNSGVYFMMIKTNDGVVTKRFVKE